MRAYRIFMSALIFFLLAPALGMLGARGLAALLSCPLDTANPHPCTLAGLDIGPALFYAHLIGWLGFLLIWWLPIAMALILVWLAVEIVVAMRLTWKR
jgi:hypothetical protein